jgi:hypothetical protein
MARWEDAFSWSRKQACGLYPWSRRRRRPRSMWCYLVFHSQTVLSVSSPCPRRIWAYTTSKAMGIGGKAAEACSWLLTCI